LEKAKRVKIAFLAFSSNDIQLLGKQLGLLRLAVWKRIQINNILYRMN